MIKTIVFDLDGTLLNSLEDIARSTNHTLKAFGFPEHPFESYNLFVGSGINKLFERALPTDTYSNEFMQKFKASFLEYYNQHQDDYTQPYSGIQTLLKQLNQLDLQLAVASNKYHDGTNRLVQKYFPDIAFKMVLGHRQAYLPKPDTAIISDILSETGSKPSEAIMVGDSSVDIQTAKNSNLKSIGVLWGFRTEQELLEAGADFTVQNPYEILEVINNLNQNT